MAKKGKLSRRSFLTTIAGPTIMTGAMATITGTAFSQETQPPENEERVISFRLHSCEKTCARAWS